MKDKAMEFKFDRYRYRTYLNLKLLKSNLANYRQILIIIRCCKMKEFTISKELKAASKKTMKEYPLFVTGGTEKEWARNEILLSESCSKAESTCKIAMNRPLR